MMYFKKPYIWYLSPECLPTSNKIVNIPLYVCKITILKNFLQDWTTWGSDFLSKYWITRHIFMSSSRKVLLLTFNSLLRYSNQNTLHWNQNKSWNEPWRDTILSNTLLLQMRKMANTMRLFSQGYISSISIIAHRPYGRFLLESLSEMTVVQAGVRVIWNRIACKEFYSLMDHLSPSLSFPCYGEYYGLWIGILWTHDKNNISSILFFRILSNMLFRIIEFFNWMVT